VKLFLVQLITIDLILKKIKGGRSGGNYKGIANNEIFRVMKFEKFP
jgi:hypothetical protein